MNAFRKFIQLKPADRMLLLEAWFRLGLARITLLSVPFRRIAPSLGRQLAPDDLGEMPGDVSLTARTIGRAVERAARYTPWNSTCLAQTIAGKSMLRRRGMSSRLYLGTRKDETGRLVAHSWLLVGGEVLIGGGGHEGFTPLSAFDDEAPAAGSQDRPQPRVRGKSA